MFKTIMLMPACSFVFGLLMEDPNALAKDTWADLTDVEKKLFQDDNAWEKAKEFNIRVRPEAENLEIDDSEAVTIEFEDEDGDLNTICNWSHEYEFTYGSAMDYGFISMGEYSWNDFRQIKHKNEGVKHKKWIEEREHDGIFDDGIVVFVFGPIKEGIAVPLKKERSVALKALLENLKPDPSLETFDPIKIEFYGAIE